MIGEGGGAWGGRRRMEVKKIPPSLEQLVWHEVVGPLGWKRPRTQTHKR